MAERLYVPSIPSTDAPCICGSEQPFGRCCGNRAEDRDPPRHLTVVREFLSPAERNRLLRFAAKQKRKWLTVIDLEKSTKDKSVQKRDPGRVTQAVDMTRRDDELQALVRRALVEKVAPVWGARPALFEPPYILRYPPGGKYVLHADAEEYDRQAKRWYRIRDRDVSLLIYLNDDYRGGGLQFDYLHYTYQPRAGDLVFFPSGHFYAHQSLPIEAGIKWAIVSWSSFAHTPRVSARMGNWRTLPV